MNRYPRALIPEGLAGLVFCGGIALDTARAALDRNPVRRPFAKINRRQARAWMRAGVAAIDGAWRESYE